MIIKQNQFKSDEKRVTPQPDYKKRLIFITAPHPLLIERCAIQKTVPFCSTRRDDK